ncbi:hypothetical protein CONCODRAFT_13393 [Conidiobolus coronatus NRRL 28638]|uniref:Uncharacterized protein n=1 Tax=Conidiobolus coronatus (strain ATCC 28846 / CBS 209.66 / NRRL 28638) TaxID=796925 RepID=A0A137NQX1_CONC2|nr:hypothetical protein CONCODRAFT_13393 [Conidiobolus coronatus NRRL 28638]|eukprot:KXN65131.1 hypothetical protein CONCODRAFT_13393 [Conidiobolus coronatus NRRL 28638]
MLNYSTSQEIGTFGAFTQTNTALCEGLGSMQKFQRIYSSLLALIQLFSRRNTWPQSRMRREIVKRAEMQLRRRLDHSN